MTDRALLAVTLAGLGCSPTAADATTADASSSDTGDTDNGPSATSGVSEDSGGTGTDSDRPQRPPPACGPGTAAGGTLVWSKIGSGIGIGGVVAPTAVAVQSQGVIVVAGSLTDARDERDVDAFLLALNDSGELQWVDRYDGTAGLVDRPLALVTDHDDAVYALVSERVLEVWGDGGDVALLDQATVLRYDADGGRSWRYVAPPPRHDPWTQETIWAGLGIADSTDAVLVDWYWNESARFTVLDRWGNADESSLGEVDGYHALATVTAKGDAVLGTSLTGAVSIARRQPDGTELWSTSFGHDAMELVVVLADLEDGIYAVTLDHDTREGAIRHFDADGQQLAEFPVATPSPPNAKLAAALHCSGDLVVVTSVDDVPSTRGGESVWVARYGAKGQERWHGIAPLGEAFRADRLHVAGTPSGDVVVAGTRRTDGGGEDEAWVGRFGGRATGGSED